MSKKLKHNTNTKTWSNLPPELLGLILKKLPFNFGDVFRFRAVCSSWNQTAESYISNCNKFADQSPWLLMLKPKKRNRAPCRAILMHGQTEEVGLMQRNLDPATTTCYSLAEQKIYKMMNRNLFCGMKDDEMGRCVGSSHGWLVIWRSNGADRYLINLITGRIIRLPISGAYGNVSKAIISTNPSCNDDFVVVVMASSSLAFYNHGSHTWHDLIGSHQQFYCDIAFYKGQLFALSPRYSSLEVWDFQKPGTLNHPPIQTMNFGLGFAENAEARRILPLHNCLMAESMGELLVVKQIKYQTSFLFNVYKLNFSTQEWEDVACLPGRALLAGDQMQPSTILSISTREFPEFEENSIYFTFDDQNRRLRRRMDKKHRSEDVVDDHDDLEIFVYNLESKIVKSCKRLPIDRSRKKCFWIVPFPW